MTKRNFVALLLVVLSATVEVKAFHNYPNVPRLRQTVDNIEPGVQFSVVADYTADAAAPEEGFRLYQDNVVVQQLPAGGTVLTFPFPQGMSAGVYVYAVAAYRTVSGQEVEARSGTLTLTVGTTPPPPQCTYAFGDDTISSVPASGGSDGNSITATGTNCTWTAVSNVPWLSLTPTSGTGSMSVEYNVQPNTGPQRTGVITVGNAALTVTQAAGGITPPPCTFTIAPTSASIASEGGNGTVTVTASDASCVWTAQSNAAWVTAGGGTTGSGVLSYSVAANTGAQRTGTLTVAGQTVTLTQAAFVPPPPPMPPVVYVLETCDGILTHPGPPDAQTGWGIQFRRHNSDGTFTLIGSRDTTVPYQRRPSPALTLGSHTFSGVWTRTGSPSVTTPSITFVCN